MTFDQSQLHLLLFRNLRAIGYDQPRPIQQQVLGLALEGRDIIGLAQTGTGKTAAFIVPLAHQLLVNVPPRQRGRSIDPASRLRALVLCPTRELARQVADEAARITQGTVLRVACAYGKVAIAPQAQTIARGIDILIATPGRVRELMDAGDLVLANVKHLVIDEADRMLDMGFRPQVEQIMRAIPSSRQSLLFTATMPSAVEDLARQFLNEPRRIEIGRHTTPVDHVQQHLHPMPDSQKVAFLLTLLASSDRRGVLIFCNTKRRVGWVGTALERNNIKVGMIHGDRSQAQRERALDRFAEGELRVLVATDVAARGLHIPAVRTVVNYDMPMQPEEYVHRIGRAGHGGGFGEAFTLLVQDDRVRWRAILDTTGVKVYAERDASESRAKRAGSSKNAGPRRDKRLRRSKKSRPIKHGQKPGRGVVRAAPVPSK